MRGEGIYFRDRRTELLALSLFLLFVALLFLLIVELFLPRLIEKLRDETLKLLTAELSTQLENVGEDITRLSGDKSVYEFFTENENWKWFFTKRLETLLTKNTVNAYLIGRSPSGDYVFLLLATNPEAGILPAEPAFKKKLFEKVYSERKVLTIRSENYVTFVKPPAEGR